MKVIITNYIYLFVITLSQISCSTNLENRNSETNCNNYHDTGTPPLISGIYYIQVLPDFEITKKDISPETDSESTYHAKSVYEILADNQFAQFDQAGNLNLFKNDKSKHFPFNYSLYYEDLPVDGWIKKPIIKLENEIIEIEFVYTIDDDGSVIFKEWDSDFKMPWKTNTYIKLTEVE